MSEYSIAAVGDPVIGINSIDGIKLEVYPNPATEYLIVRSNLFIETEVTISILSEKGALVKTIESIPAIEGKDQIEIDLGQISSGNYFLRLDFDNKSVIRNMVIIN